MNIKPNAFQKWIHRFLMLRWVSAFLAVVLHRADSFMLKISKGRHTVAEIVGLPIIQLVTTGARSGLRRIMPLLGIFDEGKIVLIGSNFGGRHNPGWYYNLKKNPQCAARVNGREQKFLAREVEDGEYERYWQVALSYYKGYALYKIRAAHRKIPVMILEPQK
ncbi:MAG: nitroreductase family deazaflavin-dependent oxidoreductase [Chloroflexi bacterium]|nr:nitroreductase family deazaflavin-dependent oxidoreductase [Chloroflexota bacterium]